MGNKKRKRTAVPGTWRHDLRGMDGAARLRTALDSIPKRESYDLVVVDNGPLGPNVLDTRGKKSEGWTIEAILPNGVVAAIADLDDPSPKTLLDNGFDVVHLIEDRGEPQVGKPVIFRVFFHDRLGLDPVEPFHIAFNGATWDRIDESA